MNELGELYQELILDHNRSPRNLRRIEEPTAKAVGYNPLCGDRVTVYLEIADGVVRDVAFEGSGCAISTAAASLMTQAVKSRPVEEAHALFDRFRDLVTSDPGEVDEATASAGLGKLAAFAGVRRFPARVKCATLVWHTLEAALAGSGETVTTE